MKNRLGLIRTRPNFYMISDNPNVSLGIGHGVTQNYWFVVFQPAATNNKTHDYLITHVKGTIFMEIFKKFRTNVNYMVYTSDCMIEICNISTITFDYQRHFSAQFTFQLHLA